MTRLATEFWVKAYLKRLSLVDISGYVIRHGDDTAGAVLIKLSRLDGSADLLHQSYDLMTGTRIWTSLQQGAERDIDDVIARQTSRDPDLWVLEIESRDGTHLLDEI